MVAVIVVAALVVLALVTQAGVLLIERAHPAEGRMVQVSGATLHIVDIGPRDAAGPPVVMLHGATAGWNSRLISYEAPTYFGMLTAAYEPRIS